MPGRTHYSPALSAACAAAIGFYGLGALYRWGGIGASALLALSFAPATAACLLRTLASLPFAADTRSQRLLRTLSTHCAAFAAGLAIGIGSGGTINTQISFGVPTASLRAVSGILLEDPRIISGGRAMAALSLREASDSAGVRASARGELLLFFPEENATRLREFGRGTLIFAEGTLRENRQTYAAASPMTFSAHSLHVVKPANALERTRTAVRLNLINRFGRASPSIVNPQNDASWGGLALALLIGIRDNMDSALAAQYRSAGCTYILALSGMHLAVLASIIAFMLKRPLGLRAAAVAGGIIIILYCFIVGPLPSLNRAALMYLIGILAALGALRREPLSLLGMAFLLQIIITPAAGYSLGFILSYLALGGILLIGGSLNSLFKGIVPPFLLHSLSASVGAFAATAGVVAWAFGIVQPVCVVVSIALVPLTTIFMIASIAWLALDFISPALSGALGPPLSLLYALMEKSVQLGGIAPGIHASPPSVIWLSVVLSLALLLLARARSIARGRLAPFE